MEPPFIKLEALENLIDLRNKLIEDDKFVLVRSFPGTTTLLNILKTCFYFYFFLCLGPVGSPIISVGGLSTPQLPDHYPYPNPTDNLGVQQAMRVTSNLHIS